MHLKWFILFISDWLQPSLCQGTEPELSYLSLEPSAGPATKWVLETKDTNGSALESLEELFDLSFADDFLLPRELIYRFFFQEYELEGEK